MAKISLIFLIILLGSCLGSEATKVVIIDKSFNKHDKANNIIYPIAKVKNNANSKSNIKVIVKNSKNDKWISPINAKVLKGFSSNNKGITFNSIAGQSIVAISDGRVVYSGNSLKSYGFMVIVKHKYGFYSNYMFNEKSLVGVGDSVKLGNKIALTGHSKFHLSMKKFTTVVDPSSYIKF